MDVVGRVKGTKLEMRGWGGVKGTKLGINKREKKQWGKNPNKNSKQKITKI